MERYKKKAKKMFGRLVCWRKQVYDDDDDEVYEMKVITVEEDEPLSHLSTPAPDIIQEITVDAVEITEEEVEITVDEYIEVPEENIMELMIEQEEEAEELGAIEEPLPARRMPLCLRSLFACCFCLPEQVMEPPDESSVVYRTKLKITNVPVFAEYPEIMHEIEDLVGPIKSVEYELDDDGTYHGTILVTFPDVFPLQHVVKALSYHNSLVCGKRIQMSLLIDYRPSC